jgi:peptidoglycan hydrolase-like protein with peptidoglycan-binding domain
MSRAMQTLAALLAVVAVVLGATGAALAVAPVHWTGTPGAPKLALVGDSTLAAVRWSNQYEPLRSYNYVFDAESCRRTIGFSCYGRDGYAPPNGLSALRNLAGQFDGPLVVMLGYNDYQSTFASAVDQLMSEARRQGVKHVVWLTMRTHTVTYSAPTWGTNAAAYLQMNQTLVAKAQQYPELYVADWATYSASSPEWVYTDGIHLTVAGAAAVMAFIKAEVDAALAAAPRDGAGGSGERECPPWVDLGIGSRGGAVVAVQQALLARGISVVGGADGVFGRYTEGAVKTFQQRSALDVTGVVDATTAERLGIDLCGAVLAYTPPPPPPPPPAPEPASCATWVELAVGSRGPSVASAQRALIARGIAVVGGADGVFGRYTESAVKTFQQRSALPVTGRVDVVTARLLGLTA